MSLVIGAVPSGLSAIPDERIYWVSERSNLAKFSSTTGETYLDVGKFWFGSSNDDWFVIGHRAWGGQQFRISCNAAFIDGDLTVDRLYVSNLVSAGISFQSNALELQYTPGGTARVLSVVPETGGGAAAFYVSSEPRVVIGCDLTVAGLTSLSNGLYVRSNVDVTCNVTVGGRVTVPHVHVDALYSRPLSNTVVRLDDALGVRVTGSMDVSGDLRVGGEFVFPFVVSFDQIVAQGFSASNTCNAIMDLDILHEGVPTLPYVRVRTAPFHKATPEPVFILDSAGRMGLSVAAPTYALDVQTSNGVKAEGRGWLRLGTSNMVVDGIGKAGFGVDTPLYALDVRAERYDGVRLDGVMRLSNEGGGEELPFLVGESNGVTRWQIGSTGSLFIDQPNGDAAYALDATRGIRVPNVSTDRLSASNGLGAIELLGTSLCNVNVLTVDRLEVKSFYADTTEFASIFTCNVVSPAFKYIKTATQDEFDIVAPALVITSRPIVMSSNSNYLLQNAASAIPETLRVVTEQVSALASVNAATFMGTTGFLAISVSNLLPTGTSEMRWQTPSTGARATWNGASSELAFRMDSQLTGAPNLWTVTTAGGRAGNMVHVLADGRVTVNAATASAKQLYVAGSAQFVNPALSPVLTVDGDFDVFNSVYKQKVGVATGAPAASLHVVGTTRLDNASGTTLFDTSSGLSGNPKFTAAVDFGGNINYFGTLNNLSDSNVKFERKVIGGALERLAGLRGYTYRRHDFDVREAGLLAQEVEAILPEAVSVGANGQRMLAYNGVIALLVEAVRELSERLERCNL